MLHSSETISEPSFFTHLVNHYTVEQIQLNTCFHTCKKTPCLSLALVMHFDTQGNRKTMYRCRQCAQEYSSYVFAKYAFTLIVQHRHMLQSHAAPPNTLPLVIEFVTDRNRNTQFRCKRCPLSQKNSSYVFAKHAFTHIVQQRHTLQLHPLVMNFGT